MKEIILVQTEKDFESCASTLLQKESLSYKMLQLLFLLLKHIPFSLALQISLHWWRVLGA